MTTTVIAPLFTLYCPHCGHDDIAGGDTLPGLAAIAGWRDNPETGKPEPEWEGSTEIVWNRQRPASPDAPYCCRRCGEFFAADELHRQRGKHHMKQANAPATSPVARIVIVLHDGRPQVLYANEHVSAVVIDQAVLAQQLGTLVERDASAAAPTGERLSVEIRREYVDSLFSGQV